eukprot:TRINITY_DN4312_c0_g1_i2.p1 TRINITY_DN4312_c0_g1~~TRINITY_DN4312_c0_g1_i2.p1  ORF type:complete len:265 (-),score=66.91 TRINITY_DN4312_c0_g1_i2:618-1376(-)
MSQIVPKRDLMELNSNLPAKKGKIQLIFGPMFSGKSTELIRRLKRYQVAQYEVLIVKYAKDVRYDEGGIATHCGQTLPAVSATMLGELTGKTEAYDVIGIDEGQFFGDVVDWCETMANKGKIVLVAALDGTFQRKPFCDILSLVPLAEEVTKLSAVCMNCFQDASFSKRISSGDGETVEVIGGADKYMAVCRSCYYSQVKVAASPRVALKTKNSSTHLEGEGVSPVKKMLFSGAEVNQNKENMLGEMTASAL